jgi:hypothetical protein
MSQVHNVTHVPVHSPPLAAFAVTSSMTTAASPVRMLAENTAGLFAICSPTILGVCAQTADFSATANFPVYDAWDDEIYTRPALIRLRFPSELSVLKPNYGKFERETSGIWLPGFFGGLGVDPQRPTGSKMKDGNYCHVGLS